MRVCVVYDCLFPYTVGGAERWYRNLSERLAGQGHDVTYLTLRQWSPGESGEVPGVTVVPVGPRLSLYTASGRRRVGPPLVFGLGVLWHLLARGRRYDIVHAASFPYFSLLAAAVARPRARFRLVVDWFELWTKGYWLEYLGPVGGRIGVIVQRACLRVPQRAFCFSRLHGDRLREEGIRGEVTVLEGAYAGSLEPPEPAPAEPLVVFAGRHIPEKRVPALVTAFARAREEAPELRCEIYGDGPDRPEVLRLRSELGLEGALDAPGFVDAVRVERALGRATCMVLPSRREGYGMVVIEAAAQGTPSILVEDPDNAATDLVAEGENGYVVLSASAADLSAAILRAHAAGLELRVSTAAWFARHGRRLSLDASLDRVVEAYDASESARR